MMRNGTAPFRLLHQLRTGRKSLVTRTDLLAATGISDPDRAMRQLVAAKLAEKVGRGQWQIQAVEQTCQVQRKRHARSHFARKFDPSAAPKPLLERMLSHFHPVAVVLFGSRARGQQREDSDWDLLVIVPDDAPEAVFEPTFCWRAQRGAAPGVFADVIPKRYSDFEAEKRGIATLAAAAYRDGITLYERRA